MTTTICSQYLNEGRLSQAILVGACNVSDIANISPASSSTYVAPVYGDQKQLIPFFHGAPRFGRSNDIDNYVSSNSKAQEDYVKGLRMTAIMLWVVLGFWCLFLLYRRLKRKGWLSGVMPKRPDPVQKPELDIFDLELYVDIGDGNEDDPEYVDRCAQIAKYRRKIMECRVVVLFCGVITLILSGLLLGIGFRDLDSFLHDATTTLPQVNSAVGEALNATGGYLSTYDQVTTSRDALSSSISTLCSSSANVVVANISVETSFSSINLTVGGLSTVRDAMTHLQKDLADLSSHLMRANHRLRRFGHWWFSFASTLVLVLDAMVIMFMVGTVLAWRRSQPRRLRNINNIGLLPLFFLLVLTAYVVSTYALIFTEFFADFCIESPDSQVPGLVDASYPFSDTVEWYVDGCRNSLSPTFFNDAIEAAGLAAVSANQTVTDFLTSARSLCDGSGLSIYSSMLSVSSGLDELVDASGDIYLSLSRCDTFNTYYSSFAYDDVCSKGTRSSAEVFIYLFLLAFFCMVIFSFRVAWHQVDDSSESVGEYKSTETADEHHDDEVNKASLWKDLLCCM